MVLTSLLGSVVPAVGRTAGAVGKVRPAGAYAPLGPGAVEETGEGTPPAREGSTTGQRFTLPGASQRVWSVQAAGTWVALAVQGWSPCEKSSTKRCWVHFSDSHEA